MKTQTLQPDLIDRVAAEIIIEGLQQEDADLLFIAVDRLEDVGQYNLAMSLRKLEDLSLFRMQALESAYREIIAKLRDSNCDYYLLYHTVKCNRDKSLLVDYLRTAYSSFYQ